MAVSSNREKEMYQDTFVNTKTVQGEWDKALLISVHSPYICHIGAQESDPKQHSHDICSGRDLQDMFSAYCHHSVSYHLTEICEFDLSRITYNERPVGY